MKLLVLLVVLLLGVWMWRRGRAERASDVHGRARSLPEPMACCARCGVHAPRDSMVSGRAGVYCCVAHRREAEGG